MLKQRIFVLAYLFFHLFLLGSSMPLKRGEPNGPLSSKQAQAALAIEAFIFTGYALAQTKRKKA
jgi:hypothetical protein